MTLLYPHIPFIQTTVSHSDTTPTSADNRTPVHTAHCTAQCIPTHLHERTDGRTNESVRLYNRPLLPIIIPTSTSPFCVFAVYPSAVYTPPPTAQVVFSQYQYQYQHQHRETLLPRTHITPRRIAVICYHHQLSEGNPSTDGTHETKTAAQFPFPEISSRFRGGGVCFFRYFDSAPRDLNKVGVVQAQVTG